MDFPDAASRSDPGCDFFIAYNRADEGWATWIGEVLEGANFQVRMQAWDFRPGANFMALMDRALGDCRQTLGVLSPAFLTSVFARAEWTAAYHQALQGRERGFVPVRIAECDPSPLLGPVAYLDLVGLPEADARERLLAGLAPCVERRSDRGFPGAAGAEGTGR